MFFFISDIPTYIYLLDQDNNFLKFDPITFDVIYIGTIDCSTTAYPYSMAVQSNGTVWTLFTDGSLYIFDIETAQCQNTSYVSGQEGGLVLFGIHFARDGSSDTERLYISTDSSDTPYRLGTIDIDTLEVSIIGYYYTMSARGELAGTNDGRLFGLFEGIPFIIAEINQTNGEILSKISENMIQYTPDSSHFAFTSYLSDFFLFVGGSSFTDIYLYNSSIGITTKEKTISNGIVGAGIW
jgi:hypothetical protein